MIYLVTKRSYHLNKNTIFLYKKIKKIQVQPAVYPYRSHTCSYSDADQQVVMAPVYTCRNVSSRVRCKFICNAFGFHQNITGLWLHWYHVNLVFFRRKF